MLVVKKCFLRIESNPNLGKLLEVSIILDIWEELYVGRCTFNVIASIRGIAHQSHLHNIAVTSLKRASPISWSFLPPARKL